MKSSFITVDANEAVALVAHRLSEVIAIYPITPASPMGELSDEWSSAGRQNLWGQVPQIVQLQSEGGAAGTVHGSLQAGALTTTFTASQGLLLMIPDMLKIAGELTPFCMHVAARSLATHALSIFGDHSDVMAARSTGFALLCSNSVQEAHDLAAIAHAATLASRIPFMHFFDGFRTSHEVARISSISDDVLQALIDSDAILAHRRRALSPDHPVIRGTAQNPDTFFQAREACNLFYDRCPSIVQSTMDVFAKLTGRAYRLYDYFGSPNADRLIVMMGSGAEAAHECVEWLNQRGENVGVLSVRLYRPFDAQAFVSVIPQSVRSIAVLDRTKEPGALADPLHLDVSMAMSQQGRQGRIIGGRYGLSSKEFTPSMVKSIFEELAKPSPKSSFTIGITDDVTHRSLKYDPSFDIEADHVTRAIFFGLGSDGTVSSNKQTIKIIGQETGKFAQGYFVYDSKKSGAMTVSHLRFGPEQIRSTYLIGRANFVACHYAPLTLRNDLLASAAEGSTFLLNTHHHGDAAFSSLPASMQQQIIDRKINFYVIDAFAIARECGLDRYISTIMQVCFFQLSGVLPMNEAMAHLRASVEKAYGKRGAEVIKRNHAALEASLARLEKVTVPAAPSKGETRHSIPAQAPDFVQRVTSVLLEGRGDELPVSAFPVDGTWPTATSQWEKRGIALEIPQWDSSLCIQCNKCALICPHAAIRAQVIDPVGLAEAPATFLTTDLKTKDLGSAPSGAAWKYALQIAPDDCTGCGLCVAFCPAKDKANPRHKAIEMTPLAPVHEAERSNWAFFSKLPWIDRSIVSSDVKSSQFLEPLFEFSGACAGCGETPYLKLLSQLFGDRLLIANATGCSSIYGGNLPTTPWTVDRNGRGPAWANSLFEDNAEFGLGYRIALDAQRMLAQSLLNDLSSSLSGPLVAALSTELPEDERSIQSRREQVSALRLELARMTNAKAKTLSQLADMFVPKSVWIVGGDGWAYDIGYGGLDHVLATGANVNVLVMDTEVYSNTGGQQSKATPLGAAAKFAAAGKATGKKDLGLLAMSYGSIYVASVAMGAKDAQTQKAFREAESYPGPSLIIAYSHCIAHGYDLVRGADQQKAAVDCGVWPLYRFDPRLIAEGKPPLQLDAPAPKLAVRDYMKAEGRFRMVALRDAKRYDRLVAAAEEFAARRRTMYEQLAQVHVSPRERQS